MINLAVCNAESEAGECGRMNILMISDGDTKYGASHSLLQMVQELKAMYNINIKIVIPVHSEMRNRLKNIGCEVFCIHYVPFYQSVPSDKWKYPIKYLVRGGLYWYGRIRAVNEIEKRLDLDEIDLIHSNSSREDLGALIANKYNIPLIWHIREFGDRDYECYSYRKNYIDYMNRSATQFISVSDAVKEHWTKKGIRKEKNVRIYNGVQQQNILPKVQSCAAQEDKTWKVVIAGSISETKGQIWAIEAVKKLLDENVPINLDIIGDGSQSYVKKLKRKIVKYGLEGMVNFRGYQKNIGNILFQYDIGLVCSKDEGFGRITVEYMMSGICVIASDTGANGELVLDGISGLLYRYGETWSLANAIKKCINNPELRYKLSMGGYMRANQEFTAKRNAMQIYDIYQYVLESAGL